MECNCPLQPDDRFIDCPRHKIKKYRRHVELCRQRGKYWTAWEKGKGPGRTQPAHAVTLAYETEAERLELIEGHIAESCNGCKWHEGCHLDGQEPVDICVCVGCRGSGRKSIRDLTRCPKKKWSLILPAQ